MNLHLRKTPIKPKHKKDGRIDPHRFWVYFATCFILVLTALIIFFTFFFVVVSRRLDKPVAPELETNSAQIKRIENAIKKTEDAVSTRTGN